MIPEISQMLDNHGINHEIRYDNREDWKQSKDTLDFSTSNPKLMTYHSAKGLQFETVFIPGVEEAYDDGARKSLYVAMTRTYRYLYIMYNGILPSPLSRVPKSYYIPAEKETVEDI